MIKKELVLVLIFLIGFPVHVLPFTVLGNVASADKFPVYITEIAWMGTDESPADEWIEIHNRNVDAIDIEGWNILADDGVPDFTINKEDCVNTTIPPGGYLLLERTNDSSVPEVSADCIYTGALNNDGENIFIYNKDGVISDFINATDNWPAGDIESKNTMQWDGSGWITATGTPKVAYVDNKVVDIEEEHDDGDMILEGPICGDGDLDKIEACDDGNLINGDGCTELCEFETRGCEVVEESGWYGEYFNYSSEHPDMALNPLLWSDDEHGDPLSMVSPWNTDWYNDKYFKFGRVDDSLTFGPDFFPFDIAQEETHIGGESSGKHEFHFGVHWRTILKGNPGDYEYKMASDDDAWVYMDGDLILDLSGVHPVNFATGTISVTDEHIVDVYFAERHTVKSHFSFEIEGDLVATPFQDECLPKLSVCKYNDLKGVGPDGESEQIPWNFAVTKAESELDKDGNLILVSGISEDVCTEYTLLPGSYNVYEKQDSNWSNTAVVEDGEIVTVSASTTAHTQDSFFDVFTQIDIDFEELRTVDFYNFQPVYCGDGAVNQDWEQCDNTDDSCTSQCQFADDNMCRDLVLAKIDIDGFDNINIRDGGVAPTTFVGSKFNALPSGTWFPLYNNGLSYIDPDISEYEDVAGLAVERQDGAIRVVLHGSNRQIDREHADGTVKFYNAVITDVASDSGNGLGESNELEHAFDGVFGGLQASNPNQDELDDDSTGESSHFYWMTVSTADDGFITKWEIAEDCIGICGVKFEDVDLDKERGEEEPGIDDWTIYLKKNEKMCLGEDFTNDEFELFKSCFGKIVAPDSDCAAADYDKNSAIGISDFAIFRENYGVNLNEDGCFVDTELIAKTTTNINGEYCFVDNLKSGEYRVVEEIKEGWMNTTLVSQEIYFDGVNGAEVLFGNARYGSIHGFKFFDLDRDGIRDDNEPTLPGWEIQLYKYPNAPWEEGPNNQPFATTSTMEDGEYWFTDVPPGVYQVFEVNQDGWEQTAPIFTTDGGLSVPPKEGGNVLPKYLVSTKESVISSVTPLDALQSKWLKTKLTGNPTMMELLQTGWECLFSSNTCPLEPRQDLMELRYYSVLIESGTKIENADFGNFTDTGEIHGTKFHDQNADGIRDDNEPTLPGWEIQLYKYPNAPWEEGPNNQPFATTSTMEDGEYWFTDVPPGVYQVFEVNQDGWEQTAPIAQDMSSPTTPQYNLTEEEMDLILITQNTTAQKALECSLEGVICSDSISKYLQESGYYSVFLHENEKIVNIDFGNKDVPIEPGEIHGTKFHDQNADGIRDDNEPTLPGWEIQLYKYPNAPWEEGPNNQPFATTSTMEDGEYWFTDVPPGVYQVFEVNQDGWEQTAPDVGLTVLQDDILPVYADDLILNENATAGGVLLCSDVLAECSEQLYETLMNLRYYSILIRSGEKIENADFGNQFTDLGDILEIFGEENSEPGTTSVTVIWNTNLPATSRVVYGPDPIAPIGAAPNYGYSTSTTVDTELVLNHFAEITGLNPDTTYYWRAISSASPEVVGIEKSFTTGKEVENNDDNGGDSGTNGQGGTETGSGPQGGGGGGGPPSLIGAYGIGGGGGIIPATAIGSLSPLSPFTPVDTSLIVQAPADDGLIIPQSSGTLPGTSSSGGDIEAENLTAESEGEVMDGSSNNQVAGLSFLGITYECGIGITILSLIILIAAAFYVYSRHNRTTHAVVGFIIGVVALWLIGSISCTFQLIVLATMVLLLLGWEARTRKGQSL